MCTQAVYAELSERCSYTPAITCQLPFCLENILSLCSFLQQAAVKQMQNVAPQRPTTSVWKGTAGAKDASILTIHAPKSFRGKQNLKCFLHKYFSSSKTVEFFFFHTEVHTSLSSTKSNVWGARNRTWKGKKNQKISDPHLMLRTYYQVQQERLPAFVNASFSKVRFPL